MSRASRPPLKKDSSLLKDYFRNNMNSDTQKETSQILGLSFYYHDSAAALIVDGKVAAAAQKACVPVLD